MKVLQSDGVSSLIGEAYIEKEYTTMPKNKDIENNRAKERCQLCVSKTREACVEGKLLSEAARHPRESLVSCGLVVGGANSILSLTNV